jgi:hypothetical protein
MNPEFGADGSGFLGLRNIRTRLQAAATVLNLALAESRKCRALGVSHDPVQITAPMGLKISLNMPSWPAVFVASVMLLT